MLHRHTADLDYSIEQQNRTLGRLRILTDKKTNRSIPLFATMPSAHMSVSVSILLSICDISY